MEMNSKGKLKQLPLGSVRPKGWLLEQLLRSKNGMGGHLGDLEPKMIVSPYTTKETDEEWGAVKAGWGAEISGNYWYGFMLLAFTLNDSELIAKADAWVEAVLKTQYPDGYLGSYTENDNRAEDYNAWGTNSGMRALLAYYSATGKAEVLEAVHRCMLWFTRNWAGDQKTRYMGICLLESMSLCYQYTGDERLIDFIKEYIDYLNRNDIYLNSQNSMRDPKLHYMSHHSAGYAANLWSYAAAYLAMGDDANLEAIRTGVAKLPMQKTGGISCHSEYLAPVSATMETEYCSFAFLQSTLNYMVDGTADTQYLDLIERIVFNGAQGARKKDEKAIAYMSAPNQIYVNEDSGLFQYDKQQYAPIHPVSCCPVTSCWVMPNFLYGMAHTASDGYYLSAYGPAEVDFGAFKLDVDTAYPFRDVLTCTVKADQPLLTTLHFRVPGWCKNAQFAVNGAACEEKAEAGSYYAIAGEFKDGDVITVKLPMEVSISRVDDGDAYARYPMAVEYGPLLFALPIVEDWIAIPGSPRTPLPEGWSWWNIQPKVEYLPVGLYEDSAARKFEIYWNAALDEQLNAKQVEVEFCEGGYVWENPQIKLHLPGYKAMFSYPPYPVKTIEPFEAPITVHDTMDLTLVPFGCTNLRISYIPRAKLPMEKPPKCPVE